jgi:hypothetical protein
MGPYRTSTNTCAGGTDQYACTSAREITSDHPELGAFREYESHTCTVVGFYFLTLIQEFECLRLSQGPDLFSQVGQLPARPGLRNRP